MDALDIVRDLIKIDTRNPPGVTTEAADYLQNLFSGYAVKRYVKEEGKDNIVVEISKGKPTIMLTSHLDTVPSDNSLLNPVLVNGKLYGRGSCDAKGSIAAICDAAFSLENCSVGLKLAFTADEEIGGVNGLGYVFQKEKADFVIIGEPTGSSNIGVLQAAVLAADVVISGVSGHTARQDAKEGAIYRASEYIIKSVEEFQRLRGNFDDYRAFFIQQGFDFAMNSWHAVFNPAIIEGGEKRNMVAGKCTIKADIRFAPWISVESIRKLIQTEFVENIRVEGFLQPYGVKYDSVDLQKDLILLHAFKKAVESRGRKVTAVFSLGIGDSRHVRKYGIPAVYFGPGGENLHGDDEFVYVSEIYEASAVYEEVVKILETSQETTD
jgi:succinyl-diaminopimelate desuccinylase